MSTRQGTKKEIPKPVQQETMITRFKSSQQKRQLRDIDRSMKRITDLLDRPKRKTRNQPQKLKTIKSKTKETTSPTAEKKQCKIDIKKSPKRTKKSIFELVEKSEFYPNKLKRTVLTKKIKLKHNPNLIVIGRTNKRKRLTPHKSVKYFQTQKHNVFERPNKKKRTVSARIRADIAMQTNIEFNEAIRIADQELTDEDLMEILTCPSPVWWENAPNETYYEDEILRSFGNNGINEPYNTEDSEAIPDRIKEESEVVSNIDIKKSLEVLNLESRRDDKFVRKRKKLEDVLGNLKGKQIETDASSMFKLDEYEQCLGVGFNSIYFEPSTDELPKSRKISSSTDNSNFSVNDNILDFLENMIIPIASEIDDSTSQITDVNLTSQITDADLTLQIIDSDLTPQITDSDLTSQMTNSDSTLKMTNSDSTLKITDSNSTLKITDSNSTLKITDSISTSKITDSDSTSKITDDTTVINNSSQLPDNGNNSCLSDTNIEFGKTKVQEIDQKFSKLRKIYKDISAQIIHDFNKEYKNDISNSTLIKEIQPCSSKDEASNANSNDTDMHLVSNKTVGTEVTNLVPKFNDPEAQKVQTTNLSEIVSLDNASKEDSNTITHTNNQSMNQDQLKPITREKSASNEIIDITSPKRDGKLPLFYKKCKNANRGRAPNQKDKLVTKKLVNKCFKSILPNTVIRCMKCASLIVSERCIHCDKERNRRKIVKPKLKNAKKPTKVIVFVCKLCKRRSQSLEEIKKHKCNVKMYRIKKDDALTSS